MIAVIAYSQPMQVLGATLGTGRSPWGFPCPTQGLEQGNSVWSVWNDENTSVCTSSPSIMSTACRIAMSTFAALISGILHQPLTHKQRGDRPHGIESLEQGSNPSPVNFVDQFATLLDSRGMVGEAGHYLGHKTSLIFYRSGWSRQNPVRPNTP